MFKKNYYTIIIARSPQDPTSTVRRIRISSVTLGITCIMFVGISCLIGVMLAQFVQMRQTIQDLIRLTEENHRHEECLAEFEELYSDITGRLEGLAAANSRFFEIAGIEDGIKGEEIFGIGGGGDGGGPIDLSNEEQYRITVARLNSEIEELTERTELQERSFTELISFLEGQENFLSSTPSVKPTKGFICSGFGYRRDPYTKKLRMHEGIDIANKHGTPIYTGADGIVSFTGVRSGYGFCVVVDHGYGMESLYAHMSSILVDEGDTVKRGVDKLGLMGCTGKCVGSHLHYEVHINGVPVDPMNYILN
ncbi:MAG: M23 family metallopeptidase [Deltaproteobacteria bacterium]|nr:M23 family metallopeptidase [Candidatus Zymogenaceae bacterium]